MNEQIQETHDRLNEQNIQRVYSCSIIALIVSKKIRYYSVAVIKENGVKPIRVTLHFIREIQTKHKIGAEQGEQQVCRYELLIGEESFCFDHWASPSIFSGNIKTLRTGM